MVKLQPQPRSIASILCRGFGQWAVTILGKAVSAMCHLDKSRFCSAWMTANLLLLLSCCPRERTPPCPQYQYTNKLSSDTWLAWAPLWVHYASQSWQSSSVVWSGRLFSWVEWRKGFPTQTSHFIFFSMYIWGAKQCVVVPPLSTPQLINTRHKL